MMRNTSTKPVLRFSEFKEDHIEFKLSDFLKRYSNPVAAEPNNLYQQIGIRSHVKGIFFKEFVTRKVFGNKNDFWIKVNKIILKIVFAWERAVSKTTANEIRMTASQKRFISKNVLCIISNSTQ